MSSTPSDRSRVLVLVKGLGIGGAERLISDGAAQWDRERFEYRVAYVLPWKDQLVGEVARHGVKVDCIGSRRGMGPTAFANLRRLARDWKPDLIHAHLPTSGIMARLATRGPVVYTEHNVASSYREPTRTANRLTYGRNAAVIAVSAAVAESLDGYPGPTPRVIPNGVSVSATPAETEAARAELGLGVSDPLVVHVGNIRPHKGHVTLIEAARQLLAHRPELTIVSIGGEKAAGDLDRVRSEAAGLGDRMRFLGRRQDAQVFLAAADVVVNPADFEGLPLAVLEALAFARPVVATAVGGVPTVVIDRVTGLLVPPRDPGALATAVIEALESPDAKGWAQAGAELVAERHGTAKMIADYEAVYREVLGG